MAAVLSLLVPGAGQMVEGDVLRAVAWAVTVGLGYYWLPLVGISLHMLCVLDAHGWDGGLGRVPGGRDAQPVRALSGRCSNCGAELVVDAYSCANCAPHVFT